MSDTGLPLQLDTRQTGDIVDASLVTDYNANMNKLNDLGYTALLVSDKVGQMIDNGVDYGNWENDSGLTVTTNSAGVTVSGQGNFRLAEGNFPAKPSTVYTMFFSLDAAPTAKIPPNLYLRQNSEQPNSLILSQTNIGDMWGSGGLHAVLFTTISDVSNKTIVLTKNVPSEDLVNFKPLAVFEGDVLYRTDITEEIPIGIEAKLSNIKALGELSPSASLTDVINKINAILGEL